MIEVVLHGGETVLRVSAFGMNVSGAIQVDTCNACDHIDPSCWERRTREAISKRSGDGGYDKGRVLYARHREYPINKMIPLAATTIHVEPALIRILHLGFATGLVESQRTIAGRRVLDCLRAIANQRGDRAIEWLHHSDADARDCCRTYGFSRVPRQKRNTTRKQNRYAGLRGNDWLVELRL